MPLWIDAHAIGVVWGDPWLRSWGLRFAAATLFVLLAHELGHWFACRRHGLAVTPPYFLPAPLGLGTFGAFLRIRTPIRTRRQLLDVGAAGPIAGFVALLIVLALAPAMPSGAAPAPLHLAKPLLFAGFDRLSGLAAPADPLALDPFLLAAWVGAFATMLNLLPLAQLDGGHVLYAAVGRLQGRIALPIWLVLAALGFLWPGWWLWCAVALVLRLRHPPVLDEREPLDRRGRWIAAAAAAIFVLCFTPVPIRLLAP